MLNLPLRLEHLRGVAIQRKKPWTNVQYRSERHDQTHDPENHAWRRASEFLILDHKGLGANSRIGEMWHSGKSPRLWFEQEHGARFLAVAASANGAFVLACKLNRQLVLWHTNSRQVEEINPSWPNAHPVEDTTPRGQGHRKSFFGFSRGRKNNVFKKQLTMNYQSLGLQDIHVADDGNSLLLFTKNSGVWLWRRGGFYNRWSGWSKVHATQMYLQNEAACAHGTRAVRFYQNTVNGQGWRITQIFLSSLCCVLCVLCWSQVNGQGWRITQIFLSSSTSKIQPCEPHQARALVIADMSLRFDQHLPPPPPAPPQAFANGVSGRPKGFRLVQEEHPAHLHPLAVDRSGGWFGSQKQAALFAEMPDGPWPGGSALRAVWDSSALCLACVVNTFSPEHARVYFFSVEMSSVVAPPPVAGLGEPSEHKTDLEEPPDTASVTQQHLNHLEVKLDQYLKGLRHRWMVSDVEWVGGHAEESHNSAVFLALVSTQGELMLLPRLCKPSSLLCLNLSGSAPTSGTGGGSMTAMTSMPSAVLPVPFAPVWEGSGKKKEAEDEGYYFSLHTHPTEPRFLVSNGFAVTEFSTGVHSLNSLLRAVINNTATLQTEMDDLLDMWRMGLSAAEWLGPEIRIVLEGVIQRVLMLCAAPEAAPNVPQQTLAKFLSDSALAWNASFQSGFHACVALTDRLFVWLLVADRLEAAFQVLHFAGPALARLFPRISVGTRYAAETSREGAAAEAVDLQRTRHRLFSSYELRNQWLALLDRLQKLDAEVGGVGSLQSLLNTVESKVHCWQTEEPSSQSRQTSPKTKGDSKGQAGPERANGRHGPDRRLYPDQSEHNPNSGDQANSGSAQLEVVGHPSEQQAIRVARHLYWQGHHFDARDALSTAGPRYLFASLCLDFHLGDLRRSLHLAELILQAHAVPEVGLQALAALPETPGHSTSAAESIDQADPAKKQLEEAALADRWGPMYMLLLLARAMASWFCNEDVELVSPFAPAPMAPQTLGLPGAANATAAAPSSPTTPKTQTAFHRQHVVVFKRDSSELCKAVQELEGEHRWTPAVAVRYFRWTRQANEAVAFCQRLVVEMILQEELAEQEEDGNGPAAAPAPSAFDPYPHHPPIGHAHHGHAGHGAELEERAGSSNDVWQFWARDAYSLLKRWSVREVGELAVATVMSEVGRARVSSAFFWLVLQWHLHLCLRRWDLNAVLSFFNAHAALLPSQLHDEVSDQAAAADSAENGGGGAAGEEVCAVKWPRAGEDASCPRPLRILFASVRRKLWGEAAETWRHSLRLSLLYDVPFPLLLRKSKLERAQIPNRARAVVEDEFTLRVPRGPPVPAALVLAARSPLLPFFQPLVDLAAFDGPFALSPTALLTQLALSSSRNAPQPSPVSHHRSPFLTPGPGIAPGNGNNNTNSNNSNNSNNSDKQMISTLTRNLSVPSFAAMQSTVGRVGSPRNEMSPKLRSVGLITPNGYRNHNKRRTIFAKAWWDEDREANFSHSLIGMSQSGWWADQMASRGSTSLNDSPAGGAAQREDSDPSLPVSRKTSHQNNSASNLDTDLSPSGSMSTRAILTPPQSTLHIELPPEGAPGRARGGMVAYKGVVQPAGSLAQQWPGQLDLVKAEDLEAWRHDDTALDSWLQQAETFLYFMVELSRTQGRTVAEAKAFLVREAEEVFSMLWFLVIRHNLRVLLERLRHFPRAAQPTSARTRRGRALLYRECARWCIRMSPYGHLISDEGLNKKPAAHLQSLALHLLYEMEVGKELEEMFVLLGRVRVDIGAENQYKRVLRKVEAHDPASLQRVHARLERDHSYQTVVFVREIAGLPQAAGELVASYCARTPEQKKAEPFLPFFSTHEPRSTKDRAEFYPSWRHRLFDSDYPLFLQQCLTALTVSNYRS
eukprot:g1548.t1